ncbi:RNA-directed DNA polymerase, eukaryota [Tanacetum coccineum]
MAARNRSNSDHTRLISKSIFVTNFPDNTSAKDLWEVCKGYGTVVDVFIPNRKSRSGKRFAFVRFIKVGNVDRLVENLCTLWIGRMHLHANVVRYDRPPISSSRPNVAPRPTVKSVSRPSANGASSFVFGSAIGEENTGLDSSLPFPPGFTPADQVKSDRKKLLDFTQSLGRSLNFTSRSSVLEESSLTKIKVPQKDKLEPKSSGSILEFWSGHLSLSTSFHTCKHKKQQAMVFKVDFAKAYDSIRWDFLEDVLTAFGFGPKWCSWIRGCLPTVLEDTDSIKSVVLDLYHALSIRDVTTVHKLLAPDLEWWFHGPPSHQYMMRLLTGSESDQDSFVFVPLSVDVFGNTVIVEGCDWEKDIAWIHAWTVGACGVITQVREYFNTSLTVTRFGDSKTKIKALHCPSVWESSLSGRVGKSVPGLDVRCVVEIRGDCLVTPFDLGQRVGEMEVWALEGFGVAYILQEMLTYKSDHIRARQEVLGTIIFGGRIPTPEDAPESFRLFVRELRSLALELNHFLVSEKTFQLNRKEA